MLLHLQHAQEYQKQMYDAKHNTKTTISVGDEVLLKNMKNTYRMGGKLDIRWTGPYEVIEDIGKMRYKLKCKKTGKILKQAVHCCRLKHSTYEVHVYTFQKGLVISECLFLQGQQMDEAREQDEESVEHDSEECKLGGKWDKEGCEQGEQEKPYAIEAKQNAENYSDMESRDHGGQKEEQSS